MWKRQFQVSQDLATSSTSKSKRVFDSIRQFVMLYKVLIHRPHTIYDSHFFFFIWFCKLYLNNMLIFFFFYLYYQRSICSSSILIFSRKKYHKRMFFFFIFQPEMYLTLSSKKNLINSRAHPWAVNKYEKYRNIIRE